MKVQPYIVATAGHVDHGKSSLIKALTGIDPDRLPEEKRRGITIDLGFGQLCLRHPDDADVMLLAGIVDVPGHEDLVKNMLAGMASVDMALLVVAADDGWMPQTEEHFQILSYLGVTRAIVALTKVDLVTDTAPVQAEIRQMLRGTTMADSPIVAVSCATGEGIENLRQAVAKLLSQTPPQQDIAKPRLWIDRIFSPKGVGTVVTGTLTGGRLCRGQEIIADPPRMGSGHAKIRSLQNHGKNIEEALPGMRVAINIPEISASSGLRRGDTITTEMCAGSADTLEVMIERLGRPGASLPGLRSGSQVHVHIGSGAYAGRLYLGGSMVLEPGQRILARLRLQDSVLVFAGDRFIIRDWQARATLAGGVVLHPNAARLRKPGKHLDGATTIEWQDLPSLFTYTLARQRIMPRADILRQSRYSFAQIQSQIDVLISDGHVVQAGSLIVLATYWQELKQYAVALVQAFHASHPERTGIELRELQAVLLRRVKYAEVMHSIIDGLAQEIIHVGNGVVRLHRHQPAIPGYLSGPEARIRKILAERSFDPPSRKEICVDLRSRQALDYLIDTGRVKEISGEVIMGADAYQRAIEIICVYLKSHHSATVAELKIALGSTRRVMVPFLEHCDKIGLTRRVEDKRILGRHVTEVVHGT